MARGDRLTPRLTVTDIGAWLFTCNPGEFRDLEPGLRAGRPVDGWCAHPTYRVGLVAAGQPAVLWVSGSGSSRGVGERPAPGIWMVGQATGDVGHDGPRPRIGLALRLLPEPLPRAALRADPRTARLEVLRAPQMSNPSVVAPPEWAAIRELLAH